MDVQKHGLMLGSAQAGNGVDIIDFDPVRGRLYIPAGKSGTLTIAVVGATGSLSVAKTMPSVMGTHCVATDGQNAFVCDPKGGRILIVPDPTAR